MRISKVLFKISMALAILTSGCIKKVAIEQASSSTKGYNSGDCGTSGQGPAKKHAQYLFNAKFEIKDIPKFVCLANDESTFSTDVNMNRNGYMGTWQILPSTADQCCGNRYSYLELQNDPQKNAHCAKLILSGCQSQAAWQNFRACQDGQPMSRCFLPAVNAMLKENQCGEITINSNGLYNAPTSCQTCDPAKVGWRIENENGQGVSVKLSVPNVCSATQFKVYAIAVAPGGSAREVQSFVGVFGAEGDRKAATIHIPVSSLTGVTNLRLTVDAQGKEFFRTNPSPTLSTYITVPQVQNQIP